jgi:hypothetical protein
MRPKAREARMPTRYSVQRLGMFVSSSESVVEWDISVEAYHPREGFSMMKPPMKGAISGPEKTMMEKTVI